MLVKNVDNILWSFRYLQTRNSFYFIQCPACMPQSPAGNHWNIATKGCRNRGDYDLMLFVANWPARRRPHWRQLLVARAIENQACVIGVNRIGSDASGLDYSGDSLAIAADGEILLDMLERSGAARVILDGAALEKYRETFPCHLDADSFRVE